MIDPDLSEPPVLASPPAEGGTWWDRDGTLWLDQVRIRDLADRFGTPLFVISETRLRHNARAFQRAFGERWPEGPVRVLPAIKANYCLALCAIIANEGFGCDVFSAGELWAALRSGVEPGRISLNGNGKLGREDSLLRSAIDRGVRITLDHKDEFPIIERIAREAGKKALIRLRLRPEFRSLTRPTDFVPDLVPTELAINAYKSGIPTDDLIALGERALACDAVDMVGVHLHVGRHRKDVAFWRGVVRGYAELLGRLKREWRGWEPREIDVGGGFAMRRDPSARAIDRTALFSTGALTALSWLASHPGDGALRFKVMAGALAIERRMSQGWTAGGGLPELSPTLEDYADAILGTLRTELIRHGLQPEAKEVQIEPGRALYGDAGVHIARVNFVKSQSRPVPWRWVNVDTSDAFLIEGTREHSVFRFVMADYPPIEKAAPASMIADIVGSSCNADRIVPDVAVPRATKPGDLVVFLDTGAYQDAGSSNFNALGRPATVLVNGAQAEIVKKAETVDDVFRRDVVPARLTRTTAADAP